MELKFNDFFDGPISTVAKQIKPLIGYSPSTFELNVEGLDNKKIKSLVNNKSKEIAKKMVKVEVFFSLISEINLDLNEQLNRDKKDDKDNNENENKQDKIILCKTVNDFHNILFSSRPRYWHHLSHEGKVLEQRMRIWFESWGYKVQLSLDLIEYFTILDKLLRINAESKRGFFGEEDHFSLVLDSKEIRNKIENIDIEDILNTKVFSSEGIYLLYRKSFSQDEKKSDDSTIQEISDDSRYVIYRALSLKNARDIYKEEDNEIVIPAKQDIENLLTGKNDASLVIKTTIGEFYIKNNLKFLKPSFKELLDGFAPVDIEERDKKSIKISIDELCESARELEIDLPEELKFREENIKNIDFIEIKNKEKTNELIFDGFTNFVGMVNTGKTNLMVVLAYALAKRGLKTCLVLRDNQDGFEQLENLNKTNKVKAVALVGSSSKPEHSKKIISSNSSKIKKSKQLKDSENILDRINDKRLEYGTYSCPLKTFFDNKNDSKNSIYSSDNPRDKVLCNNISLRLKINDKKHEDKYKFVDKKIICPFAKKCDSLKTNEYIPDGDIFITNMASFVLTKTSKLDFKNPQRISEFANKVCDLVLIDEADAMQLNLDNSHISSSPIYNNKAKPSILEELKDYEEVIRGNVEYFREHTKLLNRLSKTKVTAFEILDKFIQNKIPGYFKNGPIVSNKVFNTLSFVLGRNPEVLENYVKSLNGVKIEYMNQDETDEEKEYLKKLNTFFKHINELIYRDSSDGLTICEHSFRTTNQEEYKKYRVWFTYVDVIGDIYNSKYSLEEIFEELMENNNIVNPTTKSYITKEPKAKELVIELISLAILLAKIEGDLHKITSATGYVRSTLYNITNKDVDSVPVQNNFIKDYKGLTSRCPLGLYFGLKYNKENKYLEMISWQGIGREMLYLYPELWKYKDNNKNSGTNLAVFSGTSFMPKSPLYHIEKDVNYLMKSNSESVVNVEYSYSPIIKDDGTVVINSGKNKNNPKIANGIYMDIAQGLTKNNSEGVSMLREYLDKYTFKNRRRILVSVGNYLDALRLASFLYDYNNDDSIEIATLYKEGIEGDSIYNLPKERRLTRDKIKDIKNTKFNVVVVPQSAIQRGINMLQKDIEIKSNNDGIAFEETKIMASFSGILKTNRDYQVPNENLYAVARVSHVLEQKKQELLKTPLTSDYSLREEVNILFKEAESTYKKYYSTKFFAELEEKERDMIIGDSMVEDIQFSGRTVRGNVGTYIVLLDGAFFRNTNKGEIDDETTSTIVAMKKMCDKLKTDSDNKFIMDSLYGPFLDGIDKLITNVKEGKK